MTIPGLVNAAVVDREECVALMSLFSEPGEFRFSKNGYDSPADGNQFFIARLEATYNGTGSARFAD